MPTNTYKKIANYTVTSSSTSEIVFSSIPQTYKHLMIHVAWRQYLQSSTWGFLGINNVGGATANLNNTYVRWLGGGYSTDTQTSINLFYWNGEGNTAGFNGVGNIYIPDYTSTSKFKTMWFDAQKCDTATGDYASMGAFGTGQSNNTNAVTSLTFNGGGVAGSQITLYGLSNT